MFATGASGMSGLRYGASSQFIRRLQWVTPEGDIWNIRRGEYCFDETGLALPDGRHLSVPGQSGCDLIDFLSGSEGRLGIAAEFDLKLLPLPKECWGVVYFFTDTDTALGFAQRLTEWRQRHAEMLFAAEYYNEDALVLLGPSHNMSQQALPDFPAGARSALYVELRGDDGAALEDALETHLSLFAEVGGDDAYTWAENGPGVRRLRDMRHTLVEALTAAPDTGEEAMKWEADFAAPPGKFTETLHLYEQGLDGCHLHGVIYGHLLQNRMHVALSPQSAEEREASGQLLSSWAKQVVRNGGRLAAEYGIGKKNRPWMDNVMKDEYKADRQAIKAFFDPLGRMGEQ
jgi:D-lactate dehydrogenase (cytochrome)